MSRRRGVDDAAGLTSIDILEKIELPSMGPSLPTWSARSTSRCLDGACSPIRRYAGGCWRRSSEYPLAHAGPPDSITVRVARTGKAARIEVVSEGGHATGHDLPDRTSAADELRAMGGETGSDGPVGAVVSWMRLPLSPGASSAAGA